MVEFDEVRQLIGEILQLGDRAQKFGPDTPLLGSIPEFDSMAVVTLLMIQLQSIGRTVLVLLTAPLGLIGVAIALLVFNVPFGFVANLGVIALS